MAKKDGIIIDARANTEPAIRDIKNIPKRVGRSGDVVINTRLNNNISQPLGRITGDLNHFQDSLDASVARVLAFGASASVLAGIGTGLRKLVETGIEVEKTLADINVVFGLSSSELNNFSSEMFNISKTTSKSFAEVGKAATELARQGLGATETVKRLNDAMILSRLSGLDAEASISTLTATLNGFTREAIDSTEVINRLAAVDMSFAVSTNDLANALARSGAVAQDAGVSFNELISAVTAVQQSTARGGSVIGNGLKSIFTRIQRTPVLEDLERLGIATKDASGEFRGALAVLTDYSKIYGTLTDAQKASTDESIAGVYQINTLKALLRDLSGEYSVYNKALQTANGATDEAYTKNAQLNETLSALIQRTSTGFQELSKNLFNLGGEGAFRRLLEGFEFFASKLSGLLDAEKGNDFAKAFIGGFGSFLSGPGLVVLGTAVFRLMKFLLKETSQAFKQVSLLGTKKQEQLNTERSIVDTILINKNVQDQLLALGNNKVAQERYLLDLLKLENIELKRQQNLKNAISSTIANRNVRSGPSGYTYRAAGYIPNFAKDGFYQEEMIARGLGASPSVKAKMSKGTIGGRRFIMNNQEREIPNYGKNGDSAVIPNYADISKRAFLDAGKLGVGVIAGFSGGSKGRVSEDIKKIGSPNSVRLLRALGEDSKIDLINIPVSTIPGRGLGKEQFQNGINKYFIRSLNDYTASTYETLFGKGGLSFTSEIRKNRLNIFDDTTEGGIFESSLRLASKSKKAFQEGRNVGFDFVDNSSRLKKAFFPNSNNIQFVDAKRSDTKDNLKSLLKKIFNNGFLNQIAYQEIRSQFPNLKDLEGDDFKAVGSRAARKQAMKGMPTEKHVSLIGRTTTAQKIARGIPLVASGYIPNFSGLSDAIGRERRESGLPVSKIRAHFGAGGNPIAVTNTRDEPRGLRDVPNFARPIRDPISGRFQSGTGGERASQVVNYTIEQLKKFGITLEKTTKNEQVNQSKRSKYFEKNRSNIGFAGQFIGYGLGSYLEQSENKTTKSVGSSLSTGIQFASSAALLGLSGPASAAVGVIALLTKGLSDFIDKGPEAIEVLEKLQSETQKNSNAAAIHIQKQAEIEDERKGSNDLRKISKLSQEANIAKFQIEDAELRNALSKNAGNTEELSKNLAKYTLERGRKEAEQGLTAAIESGKGFLGTFSKKERDNVLSAYKENINNILTDNSLSKEQKTKNIEDFETKTTEQLINSVSGGNKKLRRGAVNSLSKELDAIFNATIEKRNSIEINSEQDKAELIQANSDKLISLINKSQQQYTSNILKVYELQTKQSKEQLDLMQSFYLSSKDKSRQRDVASGSTTEFLSGRNSLRDQYFVESNKIRLDSSDSLRNSFIESGLSNLLNFDKDGIRGRVELPNEGGEKKFANFDVSKLAKVAGNILGSGETLKSFYNEIKDIEPLEKEAKATAILIDQINIAENDLFKNKARFYLDFLNSLKDARANQLGNFSKSTFFKNEEDISKTREGFNVNKTEGGITGVFNNISDLLNRIGGPNNANLGIVNQTTSAQTVLQNIKDTLTTIGLGSTNNTTGTQLDKLNQYQATISKTLQDVLSGKGFQQAQQRLLTGSGTSSDVNRVGRASALQGLLEVISTQQQQFRDSGLVNRFATSGTERGPITSDTYRNAVDKKDSFNALADLFRAVKSTGNKEKIDQLSSQTKYELGLFGNGENLNSKDILKALEGMNPNAINQLIKDLMTNFQPTENQEMIAATKDLTKSLEILNNTISSKEFGGDGETTNLTFELDSERIGKILAGTLANNKAEIDQIWKNIEALQASSPTPVASR